MLNGQSGIEIDVFREALALMGHTLSTKVMHKKHLKRELSRNKNIDAVSAVNLKQDRFYYSDEMVAFKNLAVTKENRNISLNKVSDLEPYTVSTWPGGYTVLGDDFNKLYGKRGTHKKNYKQFPSQLNQSMSFWSNKTDVMIVDRYIFKHYRKMLSHEFGTFSQKVIFSHLFSKESPHYAAFKEKKLRDQFNDALIMLKQDGIYQAIVERYTK